jgi:hypothetical protein
MIKILFALIYYINNFLHILYKFAFKNILMREIALFSLNNLFRVKLYLDLNFGFNYKGM